MQTVLRIFHWSILQGGRGTGEIRRTGESGQGAADLPAAAEQIPDALRLRTGKRQNARGLQQMA